MTDSEGMNNLVAHIVDNVLPPQPTAPSMFTWFKHWWSSILDWLASLFALPFSSTASPALPDLATIATDSDVVNLKGSLMDLSWRETLKRRLGVYPSIDVTNVPICCITPSLIMKIPTYSERASMEFVRRNKSILIPRDLRPDLSWLVMDLIDGEMLYECWDKLSHFMQFRVACTLRLFVKQLRSLTSPNVGALETGLVWSPIFDECEFGPVSSIRRFRQFCEEVAFNGWRTQVRIFINNGLLPPPFPRARSDWTPVFTHGDLNSSNILHDKRGYLWIVEWGNAGFYPAFMESITMHYVDSAVHPEVSQSWRRYRVLLD